MYIVGKYKTYLYSLWNRRKARRSLAYRLDSKAHTNKSNIFRQCTYIVYCIWIWFDPALKTTEPWFLFIFVKVFICVVYWSGECSLFNWPTVVPLQHYNGTFEHVKSRQILNVTVSCQDHLINHYKEIWPFFI